MTNDELKPTRPLYEIASEIRANWTKVYFGAEPYLGAMSYLESINTNYYADSRRDIVLRFLCNASSWRGETAKRIKKELKALAGVK